MGRPTDCTPETIKVITDAVRVGCTYRLACQAAGISPQTFSVWRHKGEAGEEPYRGFVEELTRAEGEHARKLASVLDDFAHGGTEVDPRVRADAAKFMLERRHPRDYGRTVQEVEHTGTIQTVKVEFSEGATLEQFRAIAGKQTDP